MSHLDTPDRIREVASSLLVQSGHGPMISIEPLTGGRNNRVYRVTSSSASGILKHSHQAPGSGHDRFTTEVAWYEYCRHQGLSWVPEFWGSDAETRCLLLSEISGRRLNVDEVSADHVQQALQFFVDVNEGRHSLLARRIPIAAEAMFSYATMLQVIDDRISRLSQLPVRDDLSEAATEWVQTLLEPQWHIVRDNVQRGLTETERTAEWPVSDRRLSPSDFGFHNAILTEDGRLRFVDFEYAGWDDPCKLICDFYWQIDRPAPRSTMPAFIASISQNSAGIAERAHRLFPAFGIKWCSIVLNDFLHDGQTRRDFALGQAEDRRPEQLRKARRLLEDVNLHL